MAFTPNPNDAEEMARQAAYFGKPGDITLPVQTIGGPPSPPPPPDPAVASYWGQPTAPNPTFDQVAAKAQAAQNAPLAPAPPPPTGGVPSMASLRAGSAAMNAEQSGGPAAPKPGAALVGGEGSVTYERAAQIAAEQKKADKDHRPGPVGAVNSDPYGGRAARKDLYGTFPQDQAEVQNQAEADKGKVAALASGNMDLAQQRILDAAKQEDQAHHEAAIYRGYIEDSQRQLDEVRQEKVNPNRLYQDGGSAFAAIIGGVLGGVYQGINKLEKNPFIEDMNRNIDRDISLQERELARKTGSIKERQNMLGQLRETYKDENLARTQAKALYYQGAMQALDAEASTYDSPAIQAKANQAKIAMQRQLDGLKIDDASKQAAAAAAGAAAARAARQQEFENLLKIRHEGQEDRKLDIEEGKETGKQGKDDAQRFVGTGKDKDGNPTGYLERNAEGAKSREDSRAAALKLLAKIDRVQEIRNGQGTLGRTINRSNPNDTVQLYTPEWQTQLRHLNAEMTTDWAHAKNLGALSDSDRQLAVSALGDLESRGGKADEQLNELRRTLQASLDAEAQSASGAHATKRIDAHGRERVDVDGSSNAPTNQRTVARERVQ